MAQEKMQFPHKLTLNERSHLSMTGVTEVVGFDDETVILHTALGTLTVRGENLKLRTLSPEGGQVAVEGTVDALFYEEPKNHGGTFLRRLLR